METLVLKKEKKRQVFTVCLTLSWPQLLNPCYNDFPHSVQLSLLAGLQSVRNISYHKSKFTVQYYATNYTMHDCHTTPTTKIYYRNRGNIVVQFHFKYLLYYLMLLMARCFFPTHVHAVSEKQCKTQKTIILSGQTLVSEDSTNHCTDILHQRFECNVLMC